MGERSDDDGKRRPGRTAGRSAGSGAKAGSAAGAGGSPARGAAEERSTVRMERREIPVGVGVAVVLGLIAVLFLTVHPGHGQPQPRSTGPIIALVLCALMVASFRLANRIISGLTGILASFALQTPHVAHGLLYLRKGALVVAVGFALWLTLQQRHTQIDNRLNRTATRYGKGRSSDSSDG